MVLEVLVQELPAYQEARVAILAYRASLDLEAKVMAVDLAARRALRAVLGLVEVPDLQERLEAPDR